MKITVDVPDRFLCGDAPSDLARRVAVSAALFMFHTGELSAGAAAEFAGMDRFAFAAECTRHGIPVVEYDAGDLRAESESLRPAS